MVTKMTEAHILQVAALEALCFSEPWSEFAIQEAISMPHTVGLVYLKHREVAGYLLAQQVYESVHINTFCVAPAYRRQGIGSRLLHELETQTMEKGAEHITLEVRESNESALACYKQRGFFPVGKRKGFYHAPVEDALILRKDQRKGV